MEQWLNRLGNVAMIVIAAAAIIAVTRWWQEPERSIEGYQPGELIDLEKIGIEGPALLVATRSTCTFCTESLPFLRSLSGIHVVWLAVGEDADTNRKYLTTNGIRADTVVTLSAAGVTKVSATPTIVLTDKKGVVVKVWRGLLGPDAQRQVRSQLATVPEL